MDDGETHSAASIFHLRFSNLSFHVTSTLVGFAIAAYNAIGDATRCHERSHFRHQMHFEATAASPVAGGTTLMNMAGSFATCVRASVT